MKAADNVVFLQCFRDFIVDEIGFYSQLSNNNEVLNKVKNIYGSDLKSAIIKLKKEKTLTYEYVEGIKDKYRLQLNIVIKAVGFSVDEKVQNFKFEKFLSGE